MLKLLTDGGFGDAVMSYAKIMSNEAPFSKNDPFFVTHVRISNKLSDSISDFYKTQKIPHKILKIENWDWLKKHRNEFDYKLGTKWKAKNENDEESWEINPFPCFNYDEIKDIDIVINPIAGRKSNRSFSKQEIKKFVKSNEHRKICIVGFVPKDYEDFILKINVKSFLNKTTVKELINIICSSSIVIGHPGFVSYVACMSGKKVFSTKDKYVSRYFHPNWNAQFIKSLKDIAI